MPATITRTSTVLMRCDTIARATLTVATRGPGFTDLTCDVAAFLADFSAQDGAVTLLVRHTSASLTIQENAAPAVRDDLMTALDRLAPRNAGWTHDDEGPDDMPAHIRTILTDVSLTVPVAKGRMMLGTWQAIYLIEHRDAAHRRDVVVQFMGACRTPEPHRP